METFVIITNLSLFLRVNFGHASAGKKSGEGTFIHVRW